MKPARREVRRDEQYHLKGFRSAMVREALGGIAAVDSVMFAMSVRGLREGGWTDEQIGAAYEREARKLFVPN